MTIKDDGPVSTESAKNGAPVSPQPPAEIAVRLQGVDMDFGAMAAGKASSPPAALAVENAGFALQKGRFLTILGPSGSGKTTLLRIIAGFQTPTRGEVLLNGKAPAAIAPHRRSIGMVFQKLALFPHMSVAENVAFPLKMRRFDPKTIPARVERYLKLVRLEGFGPRRIHELSGGQQQRVAIARALVFEPDLLLLDEPLAALDRKLREEMQLEFRRIQRELGVTTINVTHDQREALVVSDEIIVMDRGKIMQHASPVDLYRAPANPFVAGFVGVSSFLDGTIAQTGPAIGLEVGQRFCAGTPSAAASHLPSGSRARGAIRAEQIRIGDVVETATCDTRLQGQVRDAVFEGERILYFVDVPALGQVMQVYHHDPAQPALFAKGATVSIGWRASDMLIFPI